MSAAHRFTDYSHSFINTSPIHRERSELISYKAPWLTMQVQVGNFCSS